MEATRGTEKGIFLSTAGICEPFFDLSYYHTATMKLKTTVYVVGCLRV